MGLSKGMPIFKSYDPANPPKLKITAKNPTRPNPTKPYTLKKTKLNGFYFNSTEIDTILAIIGQMDKTKIDFPRLGIDLGGLDRAATNMRWTVSYL